MIVLAENNINAWKLKLIMKGRNIRILMIILGLIGLGVSIYLFQDYFLKEDGYLCEATSFFSCTLARDSPYSVLFGVPLGAWGALWFVMLLSFVYLSFKDRKWDLLILIWTIFGILFVTYFVRAEIIIKSLCPYCTITHLIVLICFVLAILLYRKKH